MDARSMLFWIFFVFVSVYYSNTKASDDGFVRPEIVELVDYTAYLTFRHEGQNLRFEVPSAVVSPAGLSGNIFKCLLDGGKVMTTILGVKCVGKSVTTTTTRRTTTTSTTTTTTTTSPTSTTTERTTNPTTTTPPWTKIQATTIKDYRHEDPIPEYKIKVCADIAFVFDNSCSMKMYHKREALDLIQSLVNSLYLDPWDGACVGAVLYDGEVTHHIPFDFGDHDGASKNFSKKLDELENTRPSICRTKTWISFDFTNEEYFTSPKDRYDLYYGDVMVVLGDGKTIPTHMGNETLKSAEAIRNDNVTIMWVQLPHKDPEKGERSLEIEIKKVVTDTSMIYTILEKEAAIRGILSQLQSRFACNATTF